MSFFVKPKSLEDYTEVELATELARITGDFDSIDISTDTSKTLFQDLARVEGFSEYLKETMSNDIKRYFSAQTDHERNVIRGGFSRTSYLRARLLDSNKG